MVENNYVQEIVNIFNDYFGEDKVDLKSPEDRSSGWDIIVYFPEVTVTNEKHQSVKIYDLFAKVPIRGDGVHLYDKFCLMRSTYTHAQAVSGYTHSHISRSTPPGNWGSPCLGTGPINSTIYTLERISESFEEIKPFWELFCRELDEYTQVESLSGGPYIRMENITAGTSEYGKRTKNYLKLYGCNYEYPGDKTVELVRELLKSGLLKFNFIDGQIQLAMSDIDFTFIATRVAYEMTCEKRGEPLNVFINRYLCDGVIYTQGELRVPYRQPRTFLQNIGKDVITFKGKTFKLVVKKASEQDQDSNRTLIVLNADFLKDVKRLLLYLVNAAYGKQYIAEDAVFI